MKTNPQLISTLTLLPFGKVLSRGTLLMLILFSSLSIVAQDANPLLDSLRQVLSNSSDSPQKIDVLNDIAWELKFDDPEEARKYLAQAIELSNKIDYKKGAGQAYNNWGVVETIHENKSKAIANYEKALVIRQELDDKKGVASIYNNIGNLQSELEAYEDALISFQYSLRIREELKDSQKIANVHYNISVTNEIWGNYSEALDHIFQCLEISQQMNDQSNIINAYNVIGNIKTELELFEEAKENYEKAMAIALEMEDDWEIASAHNNIGNNKDDFGERNLDEDDFKAAFQKFKEAIQSHEAALALRQKMEYDDEVSASYNNIGLVYKNIGSYHLKLKEKDAAKQALEKALDYLQKSLNIREELEDKQGIMEVYNGIGDVKRRQEKYKEAIQFANQYLAIANEIGDDKFRQNAYKDLSKAYEATGKYQLALNNQKKYDDLRYDRLDESRTRFNSRREAIFGDRKKQLEIDKKQLEIDKQEAAIQKASLQKKVLIGGAAGLLLVLGLLYNRFLIKNRANKTLEEKNSIIAEEQKRSESLLLNILPKATADELKEKGSTAAKKHTSVSVLFTDFKSFTQVTESMEAEALVALLDYCYRGFDEIVQRHNIEKIKTIGDAYMCAGGLPEANETHAIDIVKAALEMQEFMNKVNAEREALDQPILSMRTGIHTGPVVAGIVGSKKFAYDIWGDTVNIAARMESSSEIGRVNISDATYQLVKNSFECIYRGKISAKNKGEVDMYFVS